VVTKNSVVLRVVRATNPLVARAARDRKQPVVFLHGTTLGHARVLENWKHSGNANPDANGAHKQDLQVQLQHARKEPSSLRPADGALLRRK
jgi:hypothetical protein